MVGFNNILEVKGEEKIEICVRIKEKLYYEIK